MIELLSTACRAIQLASGCGVVGLLTFEFIRGTLGLALAPPRRLPLALTTVFLLAGIGALASQAALVAGHGAAALDLEIWRELFARTRFGAIWRWREGLMLFVLLSLSLRALFPRLPQARKQFELTALIAIAALVLAAGSGHAAAHNPAWPLTMSHALHLAAVAIWIGALAPVFVQLRRAARDYTLAPVAAQIFQNFSRIAWAATILIVVSGAVLAVAHVARFPALLGTPYGLWLSVKLLLVAATLGLAAWLRWRILPSFSDMPPGLAARRAWAWVALEFAFACGAFLCACALGAQPPARNEDIAWPLPFRFAPEITWSLPGVALQVGLGSALVMAGAWMLRLRQHARCALLPGSIVLMIAGFGVALPPLTVAAFPDTYRKSSVAYHVISIDNGMRLFKRHCSACHGEGGTGDGMAAAALPKHPTDLTATHAANHTAGDIFWWLSKGIASGNMPGFSNSMSEEERWDVVNYLRALSNGYQSRVIRPAAESGKPWLVAPDFSYLTQYGVSGAIKEFRGKKPVMLVLFSWPESKARLDWLDENRGAILDSGSEFIAVPMSALTEKDWPTIRMPVDVQGAEQVARTYLLLRRTLDHPDNGDRASLPSHIEFLIDRFGYVRARWLPNEGSEWADANAIATLIRRLGAEDEIAPPPDEYIH